MDSPRTRASAPRRSAPRALLEANSRIKRAERWFILRDSRRQSATSIWRPVTRHVVGSARKYRGTDLAIRPLGDHQRGRRMPAGAESFVSRFPFQRILQMGNIVPLRWCFPIAAIDLPKVPMSRSGAGRCDLGSLVAAATADPGRSPIETMLVKREGASIARPPRYLV